MNYTVEHLKIAYFAGLEQLRFDQVLERISRWGAEGELGATMLPASSEESPKSIEFRAFPPKSSKRKRTHPKSKRILAFLATKGPEGAHVKEIAEVLMTPLTSVSVGLYLAVKNASCPESRKWARAGFAIVRKRKPRDPGHTKEKLYREKSWPWS